MKENKNLYRYYVTLFLENLNLYSFIITFPAPIMEIDHVVTAPCKVM